MKKISMILLALLMAGCGSMRMHGDSSGMSGSAATGAATTTSDDDIPGGSTFWNRPGLDSTFRPYYGG